MLLEQKAVQEASLVPAGHRVAASRLRAKYHEAAWASEQMGGVTHLLALRELVDEVRDDWPSVLDRMERIRRTLVNRPGMVCNVTLDEGSWGEFSVNLQDFLAQMPGTRYHTSTWEPDFGRYSEGLTIPSKVNYVAKGANVRELGHTPHGSDSVVTKYLDTTWLWERIRVVGGAYGAFCGVNQHTGILTYLSWRDPNVVETLESYDGTSEFLRGLAMTEDDLVKSIIGTIGDIDTYQLPDAKGYSALRRHLIGYTDEMRQKYRDEVLATTRDDFRAFADVVESVADGGLVVALGSQDSIDSANNQLSGALQVTKLS
jgi:Zn-dependent M16 (insulinase) family peptidase